MTLPASPNVLYYSIFRGACWFKEDGEADYRHMGNCPVVTVALGIEKLEHESALAGVAETDRTIITRKSATITIQMEEPTAQNLRLKVLGTIATDSDGEYIDLFASNAISGLFRFVGSNEVGEKFQWDLNKVDFGPEGDVALITAGGGVAQLGITGDLAVVNGKWGKIRRLGGEAVDA
jgi:hypothetical protein